MSNLLEVQSLTADLAALDALLARAPKNDFGGRIGLESRRREVEEDLRRIKGCESGNLASVALFFGGRPVMGSRGIEAAFAGEAISNYQDLLSKISASGESGQIPGKGPVRNSAASQLHVTEVLHGSFGFLLQELDELGEPMFRSQLRDAAAKATQLILAFLSGSIINIIASI